MKLLVIADLHSIGYKQLKTILTYDKDNFDIIITLGDIYEMHLKLLKETFHNKKIIGLEGNHDTIGTLNDQGIIDIHNKYVIVKSTKFIGLAGSVRYKSSRMVHLYDQYEMEDICEMLPDADIVISHNSPFGIHDETDIAHEGFIGLKTYIDTRQPKYCIHGHQHINKTTICRDTTIIGVYGAVLLDTETGKLEVIEDLK